MFELRKIAKSKKALSPVVAAIILIAVTVAVSIAVAAWMGALTLDFIGGAEQLKIIEVRFPANENVTVEVQNTGPSAVTIEEVRVDGNPCTIIGDYDNTAFSVADGKYTLAKGEGGILTASFISTPGTPYEIAVKTAKNLYPFPATA